MNEPAKLILGRLKQVRECGDGWSASCPAHEDTHASLSVGIGDRGQVLLNCHAGCSFSDITRALGVTAGELKLEPLRGDRTGPQDVYEYAAADGHPLFQVLRLPSKQFPQRRPDGLGSWVWGLRGAWYEQGADGDWRRSKSKAKEDDFLPEPSRPGARVRWFPTAPLVLYRLPRVLQAVREGHPIFIVEGEKDVHTLERWGLVATCNPMGAGKWRDEYSKALRGAEVIILPDNDQAGREHARAVAAALTEFGTRVSVLELPDLAEKGDISDWAAAGGTREELERLMTSGKGQPPAATPPRPLGILASQIRPEVVRWLWPGRIPQGKLVVLDGDPGLGKSTACLDIAARLSRGDVMPDGTSGGEPSGVVILSAEDGLADTIVPRLIAAGADLTRILLLAACPDSNGEAEHPPLLPDDLPFLTQAIVQVDACLVVVDPLMAYLAGKVNSYRDQDVRRALFRLSGMAEETGASTLVVRHLNKAEDGPALYRGGGSIGIVGAARSALLVGKHPDDDEVRVLASTKSNLGPAPDSLAFHLEPTAGGVCRVRWDGRCDYTADQLVRRPRGEKGRTQLDEAKDFLEEMLAAGRLPATDIYKAARSAGVSETTLERAKKALNVQSKRDGFGQGSTSFWSLPHTSSPPPIHLHPVPVEKYGDSDDVRDPSAPRPEPEGGLLI
ncbi:MAG: AAA family ATPase [Thermoleophilia bacterium]|nr:AAA family ATPase [Thermoleophilia bacterium]